ncbi:conserved hypothetical protein [Ahrensia sp. R2A130]|nr:conserved hypothetical protein [Ahrensia sp. R2A130]
MLRTVRKYLPVIWLTKDGGIEVMPRTVAAMTGDAHGSSNLHPRKSLK